MATWAASSPGWKVRIVTANSPIEPQRQVEDRGSKIEDRESRWRCCRCFAIIDPLFSILHPRLVSVVPLPHGLFTLVRADHPQGRALGTAFPWAERPQHHGDAGERQAGRRQDGPGAAEDEQDRPDPGQDQTTDAVEDEVYSIIQRHIFQAWSKMARSQRPRQLSAAVGQTLQHTAKVDQGSDPKRDRKSVV